MHQLREIKDQASLALARGQWQRALALYVELARAEPEDGTWSLRAGDAAHRLGQRGEAVAWYERAAMRYRTKGLVVRAIAVAKMIESIEPGNDRALRSLDAEQNSSPGPAARAAGVPASDPGGPPLVGRLSGPPLQRAAVEDSMPSIEILFDDADDGIPVDDPELSRAVAPVSAAAAMAAGAATLEQLPSFPLFEVLPKGAFLAVVSRMVQRRFHPGQVIVHQGDVGTTLFAIIEGQARVFIDEDRASPLTVLGPGDVFGEMALVLDQPRAATVEAMSELELFEMDRELFREVIGQHPQLGDIISRLIKRRLVDNVVATSVLFQELDDAALHQLKAAFEVREVAADTLLAEQHRAMDALYLVLAGKVHALQEGRVVATLGPGRMVGLASLIEGDLSSRAGFRAPEPAIVLRLPRSAFRQILLSHPTMVERLNQVLRDDQAWDDQDQVAVV